MPTETFYKLNDTKRENIISAIRNELSIVSNSEVSINKIIVNAGIPRGSFYQYFKDKNDAIQLIVDEYIEAEKRYIKQSNGDIFTIMLQQYDYIIKKYYKNYALLYMNIFEFLRSKNYNSYEILSPNSKYVNKEITQYLDLSKLNYENQSELNMLFKILTIIMRSTIIEVFSKKITVEEGREQLKVQIKILKQGMIKGGKV